MPWRTSTHAFSPRASAAARAGCCTIDRPLGLSARSKGEEGNADDDRVSHRCAAPICARSVASSINAGTSAGSAESSVRLRLFGYRTLGRSESAVLGPLVVFDRAPVRLAGSLGAPSGADPRRRRTATVSRAAATRRRPAARSTCAEAATTGSIAQARPLPCISARIWSVPCIELLVGSFA